MVDQSRIEQARTETEARDAAAQRGRAGEDPMAAMRRYLAAEGRHELNAEHQQEEEHGKESDIGRDPR